MTTSNEISGDARLSGLVVQARDIHGDLHHHAAPQPLPTPHQLPPVAPHFVDRAAEINALDAARRDGSSLVVITGLVGVGKTALATRWLSSATDAARPELYAELSGRAGPARPEDVLRPWLRAFGIDRPPAGLQELSALWRSVTAARPVTILLDNVVEADQVPPLLPAGSSSTTVVTSRGSLWELAVDGAAHLPLRPLAPSSSITLLARFIGEERIAAEPEAAARLATRCAHLPLPLALAGARLKSRPEHALAAAAAALAHPRSEDPVRMAISAGLTETYNSLGQMAQYVYRSIALLPVAAVDPDMVSAVCRLERADAERLLGVLADEQLLTPDTSVAGLAPRYRLASAVHEHALTLAERHDDPAERRRQVGRLYTWVLAIATQAQRMLTPAQATLRSQLPAQADAPPVFHDEAGAMAWLEAQESNLLGVLEAAVTNDADDVAWMLVDAFWPLFLRRHPYPLWIQTHEDGLAAARRTGNAAAVRQMLLSGAIGLSSAGRLEEALTWYGEARQAAQAEGDVRDEGQALLGIGACHHESGRPEQAEPYLTQAVALWKSCGYRRGVALATILLGEISLSRGAQSEALDQFTAAHSVLAGIDDSYDAARALALRGHARVLLGDLDVGVTDLEKALTVFAAASSTRWQARALEMLGRAHRARGRDSAARDCFRQAADLVEVIRPDEAERLRRLEEER
ncbi:tetratricopeptide repeat protein [Streptomyces marianii]|uniref:Tetratricopeptide repeat protein n=1 Tax=Streptomyces marianii TaxID=1817406 RepID=A0A5R9DU85_9ACTN|nr:tetratricopeptide repeat protein [Streptomyces marianii]TLQ39341.1 tetratricopeptide repeat protein [Streptomyces marianii]